VGIDAEPNEPVPDGVLEEVALDGERVWVEELGTRRPDVCWDRLLFSVKESVYKAWYPLTGLWLGFEQAIVEVDPDAGTFRAQLLVPGPSVGGMTLSEFLGRWLVGRGLILTAIALPAAG
jgi:4'-phosphopantetheinyl transferase EntD